MKYERSDWYIGLLFAESQRELGFRVCEFDCEQRWFSWMYGDTEGIQVYYGSSEWLDGVMDYYRHLNNVTDRMFGGIGGKTNKEN